MTLARIRIQKLLGAVIGLAVLVPQARADVMLQGFWWNVPKPGDSGFTSYWWDKLASDAHKLRAAGFTSIWIPNPLKGASGSSSMGYDPFDDYDLGSKSQKGTTATRFGTRDQLQRMVAMMRANGLGVYVDVVANHRQGYNAGSDPFHFWYSDAYGNSTGGRFEKFPCDFHNFGSNTKGVPEDPNVPDPAYDSGAPFGPDLAPVNGCNRNAWSELNDAGDWLTKALGCQGYRLDYIKGVSTDWLKDFLGYGAMNGKFAVGEYWDGDRNAINSWMAKVGSRSAAFDFPLRFDLYSMCMTDTFPMRNLDHDGLQGINPGASVTFVENHDTDKDTAQVITKNKRLAYAYILTSEGLPCVFYKDYLSKAEGGYGYKGDIDKLIWIHENIATGTTLQRWLDSEFFVYSRAGADGKPALLVGLNRNATQSKTVTVGTPFPPNTTLNDYAGHMPNVTTNATGQATITIPANGNTANGTDGLGYVCYSITGIPGTFHPVAQPVTQEFAGATDLDIKPADPDQVVIPAKVYCQVNTSIRAELYYDATDWTPDTRIDLSLVDPSGNPMGQASFKGATVQGLAFTVTSTTFGYHVFSIQAYNTPATNPKPRYWLKVTYTAPPFFPVDPPNALKAAGGLLKGTADQAAYSPSGAVDLTEAVRLQRIFDGLGY